MLKTRYALAAEEALKALLEISITAASACLKDALYQCIKNVLIKMTRKATLKNLSMINLKLWALAPQLVDSSTQNDPNTSVFTHSMTTVMKRQTGNTSEEWFPNLKKDTHHTGTRLDTKVSVSPLESSACDGFPVPMNREREHAHTREHNHMQRQENSDKYLTHFLTGVRFSKVHFFYSDSSADCKSRRREESIRAGRGPRSKESHTQDLQNHVRLCF